MFSPQPNYTPQDGADHRQRILNRLSQLAELKDNWDGEGSFATKTETIERMKALLIRMPMDVLSLIGNPEYDLYLSSEGDLFIDWDLPDGQIVATIIVKPDAYSGYLFNRKDEALHIAPTNILEDFLLPFLNTFSENK